MPNTQHHPHHEGPHHEHPHHERPHHQHPHHHHHHHHHTTTDGDHFVRRPSTLSLSLQLDVPDNVIVSRRASSVLSDISEVKDPGLGWRHIQILLMCSAVLGLYTHRSCLSVAIVAMNDKNITASNPIGGKPEAYEWSRQEQGMVLSAYLWGYAVTQVPAGYLTSHFGAKRLMGLSLASSSIVLLAIPFIANQFGWIGLVILRALTGAIQGITYPGTYTLLGKWATPQERSKASAFSVTSHAAGIALAMGLSGYLTETWGWPCVFYVFGVLTGAIAIFWFILCADSPEVHPWISVKERDYIISAIGHESKKITNARTPWSGIFTNIPFLSLCICQMGYVWGQWKVLTALPRYMKEIFDLSPSMNGLVSAAPYVVNSFVGIVSGWLSDILINNDCMSAGFARKLFNTIGFWGLALLFLAVPFTPSDQSTSQVAELIVGIGLFGGAYSGLMVNYVELSPRFSGLTMAVSNGVASVASAVALPISDAFVDIWGETDGWAATFYLTAVILFVTNLIWLIWGTSEKQAFNDVQEKSDSKKNGIENQTFDSP